MTDLTIKISGMTGKDGDKPTFICAEHEHQRGVLVFAWEDNAEEGNRYAVGCTCYGDWSVIKFAAALKQMRRAIGDEMFAVALMEVANVGKYEVKEDKQHEQDGVD